MCLQSFPPPRFSPLLHLIDTGNHIQKHRGTERERHTDKQIDREIEREEQEREREKSKDRERSKDRATAFYHGIYERNARLLIIIIMLSSLYN